MNGTLPNDSKIPLGNLPPEQVNAIIAQCASAACTDAKAALQAARNEVLLACDALVRATAARNLYMGLMIAFYTLAIACFAAAGAASGTIPIIGLAIAAVLAAIGTALLVVALIFTLLLVIQQKVVDDTTAAIAATKAKFLAAVSVVLSRCNEYCRPNLDLPACPPV